ncbi:MAG TPA: hypothetical protein VK205_13795, partial [Prolixibacteraceae bacterium]|nr:hypothetical protein [Prolixibacteraceae bacterium]
MDLVNAVKIRYPDLPLPDRFVPKWLFSLMAPMIGFTRKYVKRNIGVDIKMDNSRIAKDLGITFYPFEKTVEEHFNQLMKDGAIKNN